MIPMCLANPCSQILFRDSISSVGGNLTPPPMGALSESGDHLSTASSSLVDPTSPQHEPAGQNAELDPTDESSMQVVSGRVLRCSVCSIL